MAWRKKAPAHSACIHSNNEKSFATTDDFCPPGYQIAVPEIQETNCCPSVELFCDNNIVDLNIVPSPSRPVLSSPQSL